jgi:Tol biopolymer transport system component
LALAASIGQNPGEPATFVTVPLHENEARPSFPRSVSVSANGQFVAFVSAVGLAPADTNGRDDVYVLDVASGNVSFETDGVAQVAVDTPVIDATGRFLAYEVEGAAASQRILMLKDRDAGTVRPLQRGGERPNGSCRTGSIGAGGRYVAFASAATNLMDGDVNGPGEDVYVADVPSMSFRRIGAGPSGGQSSSGTSFAPVISEDGRFVAFSATTQPFRGAAASRARTNTYVHDLQAGRTAIVGAGLGGAAANGSSYGSAISADGRYVAFVSDATNLVRRGDTNGAPDVYVRDTVANVTELVSRTPSGMAGNGASRHPVLSGDGRFVVFQSDASDLTCGDRCPPGDRDINLVADIFRYDRQTGVMERISRGRTPWMEPSIGPATDRSGAVVAFVSRHPLDQSDDRHDYDLFVWARGVRR